jgi:hypothetical protein
MGQRSAVNITEERQEDELSGDAATAALCGHLARLTNTRKVKACQFDTRRELDGRLTVKLLLEAEDGVIHDGTFSISHVWARVLRDRLNRLYPVVS